MPNGGDCRPQDDQTWAVPDEVAGLRVAKDPGGATLSWDSLAAQAGPSTVHDVVTGAIADLHASGSIADATCLADSEPLTVLLDDRAIAPDSATWYLVRGECPCGLGPYGADSMGVARGVPTGDCP